MHKTRLSLYYLTGYLLTGGLGFLLLPQTMLELFQSNGTYSDLMVRMTGLMLLCIGIIITQFIRHNVVDLYGTTLFVRSVILFALFIFYMLYEDPLMIVLMAIVGFGFVLTLACFVLDRRGRGSPV